MNYSDSQIIHAPIHSFFQYSDKFTLGSSESFQSKGQIEKQLITAPGRMTWAPYTDENTTSESYFKYAILYIPPP